MKGVMVYPDGREVCDDTAAGRREYYARMGKMMVRQDGLCVFCGTWLGHDVTFEHQDGRGLGGGLRDDRIEKDSEWYNAAAHQKCNQEKGSRRYRWLEGKFVPAVFASLEDVERMEMAR